MNGRFQPSEDATNLKESSHEDAMNAKEASYEKCGTSEMEDDVTAVSLVAEFDFLGLYGPAI
jgi:hypothetical protein